MQKKEKRIADYFAGKSIFLTGGTGFIGKSLIEKFLRCCPDLANVYVLIRGKKGETPQQRLMRIVENRLFDTLKCFNPSALNKLIAIEGDANKLKLGIIETDRQILIEKVNFIYHVAASVRFDDHLRDSIFVNVRSTREVIELALEVKNLLTFVYVSTTYCNVDKGVVYEKVYPSHGDWREAIKIAEEMDPKLLEIMTTKYIEPMPNTYTFAKGLAEVTVSDLCKGRIPAIIVRPSVVVSTYFDPIPGWNDNFNGPVGLLVAGGKGLLRITYGNPNSIQDYIPVDVLNRALIICTVEKCKTNDVEEIEVYNCSKYKSCPITVRDLVEMGAKLIEEAPFRNVLWYPRFSLTNSWYSYYIQVIIFHMIPAFFLDMVLKLAGKKPMLFKIQRKIYLANCILYPFISQTWDFVNTRTTSAIKGVPPEDHEDFDGEIYLNFGLDDAYSYFKTAKIGAGLCLFNETFDETTNKTLMRRRWMLDIAVKTVFALILYWYLFIRLNVLRSFVDLIYNMFV